ncbi:MAG TPA: hypothetical protein PKD45_13350 [Flavobacteriales bacterium]|nr:hypothetical protein [Flavobacteriales bacterium]
MARRLPIPTATGLLYLPHDCVMHLQAEGSYTLVRCTSNQK